MRRFSTRHRDLSNSRNFHCCAVATRCLSLMNPSLLLRQPKVAVCGICVSRKYNSMIEVQSNDVVLLLWQKANKSFQFISVKKNKQVVAMTMSLAYVSIDSFLTHIAHNSKWHPLRDNRRNVWRLWNLLPSSAHWNRLYCRFLLSVHFHSIISSLLSPVSLYFISELVKIISGAFSLHHHHSPVKPFTWNNKGKSPEWQ